MKSINILLTGCWLGLIIISGCKKEEPTPPTVKTSIITDITQTTATGGGQIVNDGGKSVIDRGVCWGTTNQPTINDSKTSDGDGDGSFISSITGLNPGVLYYVRAYATNGDGTGYGESISFRTNPVIQAEVTTNIITDINSNSAKSGGAIISTGGAEITACGVCWSLNHEPKITDNKTIDVLGGSMFTSTLTNLEYFKTYYVRAYATNLAGTAYGNEREFKTEAVPPTVITNEITNRSYRSVTAGGNVTADGGNPVTDKGICYATHTNPKFNENNKAAGYGLGPFYVDITSLEPNTVYHVRAYAATSADTAYGADIEFKTLEISVPAVTTKQPNVVGSDMALSGGIVASDGGSPVTARGVCWNLTGTPMVNDSKTLDGSGTGSFDSYLTGLLPYNPVYVRAYATNAIGTGYGEEFVFMPCSPPLILNLKATDITGASARISFDLQSFDGSPLNTVLYLYNSEGYSQEFRAMQQWENFTIEITGLEIGTKYYCRAIAINQCGDTNESQTISFTTLNTGTLSDVDGNIYKTIKIGSQIWMAENLRTTKYNDNSAVPLVEGNVVWASLSGPGYCWYNNDKATYGSTYGALYNWYTVNTGMLCPLGWHVPSNEEWTTLINFIGGESIAGGKLKSTTDWFSPNIGATDEFGFNGLPGGDRYYQDGLFRYFGNSGNFWSSSVFEVDNISYSYDLQYQSAAIYHQGYSIRYGRSIRCLKDK